MHASCSLYVSVNRIKIHILIPFNYSPPWPLSGPQRNDEQVTGSDVTMDTAMYIHSEGGEKLLVPVRPANQNSGTGDLEPETDPASVPPLELHFNYDPPADIDINCEQENPPRRDHSFYMKEFVARVDEILQAMQATEVLPESATCANCGGQVAEWRCGGVETALVVNCCADSACGTHISPIHSTESNAGPDPISERQHYGRWAWV
jgi:hypothetical protein